MEKQVFNAYIDAYNLYYGALESNPELKWLDLNGLCRDLMPGITLGKVYYFTARVKERYPRDAATRRQHAYLRALSETGVEVVLGKFRKDPKWQRLYSRSHRDSIAPPLGRLFGLTQHLFNRAFSDAMPDVPRVLVYKMEEKGSDVNLASHLLRDCLSGSISTALVITGDSDQVTPIKFCIQSGADVKVVIPKADQYADELAAATTNSARLSRELLESNQLPDTVIRGKGSPIRRPHLWA